MQPYNCITVQYIKYIQYKCKHSVANHSLNNNCMQILGLYSNRVNLSHWP